MRVIICGAGQVGYNIASYLAREDNDITVIDKDQSAIDRVNDNLDVNGIHGLGSNPDILLRAGANDADILIAVTNSDEVNMTACQVASSLFNIPKKIARIREQSFLDPSWSNLFSRAHLPIDVIISPEVEVARSISRRLSLPGCTDILSMANGIMHLVSVTCTDTCPVLNTPLRQIDELFSNLDINIALIVRGGRTVMPHPNEQILPNDEVYFFVETDHVRRAMAIFGHEEPKARNITILGGGNIGFNLAKFLCQEQKDINLKLIEPNVVRARFLSENLPKSVVLCGSGLDKDILEEANIERTETIIAVTNNDEINILASLLAKNSGCQRAITLINNTDYNNLSRNLGIDVVIMPQISTVSKIMQNVRRGRIRELHALRDGFAEALEIEISDTSGFANHAAGSLDLPKGVIIGAVIRNGKSIKVKPETIIRPGDRVIIVALQEQARKVEKMFTVQVDLFQEARK